MEDSKEEGCGVNGNLRPVTTTEEAKKRGSNGGKKSAQRRREKRSLQELINDMLSSKIVDVEKLKKIKEQFPDLKDKDIDKEVSIVYSMITKAEEGSLPHAEKLAVWAGRADNPLDKVAEAITTLTINVTPRYNFNEESQQILEGIEQELDESIGK